MYNAVDQMFDFDDTKHLNIRILTMCFKNGCKTSYSAQNDQPNWSKNLLKLTKSKELSWYFLCFDLEESTPESNEPTPECPQYQTKD